MGVIYRYMKKYSTYLSTLVASIILFAGVPMLYAWTAPAATPPLQNAPAPITVSNSNQNKIGALGLGGLAVFGKSLLTETNDYSLPSSKPSMLLGVNGAIGAKEYCDENGTNCVKSLGGGSSSGIGWVNVPLSDTGNFDADCQYRWKMNRHGDNASIMGNNANMYSTAVDSKSIVQIAHNQISYISSTNKSGLNVDNSAYDQPTVYNLYTVTKMEKLCIGTIQ